MHDIDSWRTPCSIPQHTKEDFQIPTSTGNMNIVEMQPAALPPTFPVSDTRPAQPTTHLEHAPRAPQHADSRPSSKDSRPPTTSKRSEHQSPTSPRSARGQDEQPNDAPGNGQLSPQSAIAGKKRSANGEVKDAGPKASRLTHTGRSRSISTLSNGNDVTVVEVRQVPSIAC